MTDEQSKYLNYLPAIYQEPDLDQDQTPFLGRFLLAFEQILSGLPGAPELGLEQIIAHIYRYFDPCTTDEDFLPWLANWVSLSLRADWSVEERRRLIRSIVSVYRIRGTKAGLERMLTIYSPDTEVQILEFTHPMQVGVSATVGLDSIVGDPVPHHFFVSMLISNPTFVDFERKKQIVRAIIDQEKPAHTSYDLDIRIKTMQVGVHSTVGVDTLLGTPE
jgi:phage tail-like protein